MAAAKTKTNTRKKRAAAKAKAAPVKPKAPATTAVVQNKPRAPKRLSSVIGLSRQAVVTVWSQKGLFAGIVAIYVLLNVILVSGLGSGFDIVNARNQVHNKIVGSLFAYTQLLGTTASAPSESGGVYQLVLLILVSLALVWTLRQIYAGNQPRVRDSYYKSMYPLVPFILLLIIAALQLLPMIIGSALYQTLISNGIATTPIEIAIAVVILIGLTLLSFYFEAASLFSLIIGTLPDMTPLRARKLARDLVRGRRWTVLRKVLFLPIMLLAIATVVLLPLVLVAPVIAPIVLAVFGPLLLVVAYSYVYALYRELVGD